MKIIILLGIFLFFVNSSICFQSTNFVNKEEKVKNYAESSWFINNIPFLEVPVKEIEDVYYYRWSSLKRHLKYNLPGAGYTITEFVHKVFYSQKFDTINAAAGHHIMEARWLRDQRFVKDYINFWTREGGAAQQYSEWIADSAYKTYLVNGDAEFIKSQQKGLINNFNNWGHAYDPELGLYFISPHDDAMELSASSIPTDDPYRGGLGYRPSFNSEMYGNALAISKIATMNNDNITTKEFELKAISIRENINRWLWDEDRQFYYHMHRINNPGRELLDSREEIGFYPWKWDVPDNNPKYNAAWEQLFNQNGFEENYGPTTCEKRSQWYDGNQTNQCCWWNGNSWPYSTSHTLNSVAAQIRNYGVTAYANIENLVYLFTKYALTQYKDGIPYVAECHSPWRKLWVCDSFNHSEHYAHSTYVDNVLIDLIGITPRNDNFFEINPLIPETWNYFIVENIFYHSRNITILYDKDGTKYSTGRIGLQGFVDGELRAWRSTLGHFIFAINWINTAEEKKEINLENEQRIENYATNPLSFGYPTPEASYTSGWDSVWQAIDGRIFYDAIPSNRWTNYGSPSNNSDWFSIDFGRGRFKTINKIKIYIFSDFATGIGHIDCPKSIIVEYKNDQNWVPVSNQESSPCIPNDVMIIKFSPLKTQNIRLVLTRNFEKDLFVGFTELEIWAPWPQTELPNTYEAEDGLLLGNSDIFSGSTASGGSFVQQINEEESSVEFTGVFVNEEKDYEIIIFYANGGSQTAIMDVKVNNIIDYEARFTPTSNWDEFSEDGFFSFFINLQKGNNVIIFKYRQNNVQLDKLEIVI